MTHQSSHGTESRNGPLPSGQDGTFGLTPQGSLEPNNYPRLITHVSAAGQTVTSGLEPGDEDTRKETTRVEQSTVNNVAIHCFMSQPKARVRSTLFSSRAP